MHNIGYIIDKLLRNHKIVFHWISYQPFEQPGPDYLKIHVLANRAPRLNKSELLVSTQWDSNHFASYFLLELIPIA